LIVYIPPALKRPAGYQPGSVSGDLIESIDLTATTLALAGIPKPKKMEGHVLFGEHRQGPRKYAYGVRDRCDMTMFRIRSVRDAHYRYVRNFMPEIPFLNINLYKETSYPAIGVMRRLHEEGKLNKVQDRFFDMTRPAEELYWIDNDPWEIHNLATSDDPRHQAALRRLRRELDDWIVRTGDQGAIPEPMAVRLKIFADALARRNSSQLTRQIIKQQRISPGISPEYSDYLEQVQELLDRVPARPAGGARAGKKKGRKKKGGN